ncbi:neurogenic locus notch homolog protein 2-like [Acanthaster planci]|uniref:Neurogenic locus notch homolog protein 2-like n=1 Tax=Acanthaster planci TaxID=133434 RepID=A0A8B7XGY8_ACAPL|nr:neurogenic locus notch homolog protein 2-like [Acanthaster planci]XP_022079387.1 neurogenic locus notch homolog protein 2-like [Acanthaster planci]
MEALGQLCKLIFVAGLVQSAVSQVTIENCPGNIYSKTGEAEWALPTARTDSGLGVNVECDHSHQPTLYTAYTTKVVCTAKDWDGYIATCSFNIYLPDGAGCPKRPDNANDKCSCSMYRPFFYPCGCIDSYSGLTCQVLDGNKCSTSNTPSSCDCNAGPCRCHKGFKGESCELDFQVPEIICPQDIYTVQKAVVLPGNDSFTATDNDGNQVAIECSPPLGTVVTAGTGNTTVHGVTCSARDSAGNRADCSFKVVIDLVPPRIPYCPGNMHTNDFRHEWPVDMAVDNSHPTLNVTCEPAPGEELTDYVTNVNCYVHDKAGNAAEENCTFQIYLDGGSCNNGDINCECDGNSCSCADGFSGIDCTVEDGSICAFSGEPGPGCVCNGVSNCTCRDGFKGASCEIDFMPPELSNCPFGEIWSRKTMVTYRPMWTKDNNHTDVPTTVVCYPEEGSEFLAYRTDVTCSAEDASGNKELDCEFPVMRISGSGCESDGNNCYNCQSRCRCLPGYVGPNCQVCGTCENGGTREDPNQCQCQCPTLHHGLDCDECYEPNADHCMNQGTFIMDTCSCECEGDWTGRHCEQKPGEECSNLSANDSLGCSCSNEECTCKPAYSGPKCDSCKACQNGGSDQEPDSCVCNCPGFYLPPICSECDTSAVCQNGGTLDEITCTCHCASGWRGEECADEVTFEHKCPIDIIKRPDEGQTTAKVSWTGPTESGANVDCQPASGSQFPVGTTQVTCTAIYADPGTNSSSCSFKVFIDGRAPLVNCPPDLDPYHQRWKDTAQISWGGVTAEDEVSGTIAASCIPRSGSVFQPGATTVVCTAFDQAMNLGFCTFEVTVYTRGNTIRFPTTLSCAKCQENNPNGRCRYDENEDEYVCYCSSGFTTDANGKCQDIDECNEEGRCEPNAECVNTVGSYRCECSDGFFGSGTTCREYPYPMYPDISNPEADKRPLEKMFSVDVRLASESMFGCDLANDPMSDDCQILQTVFNQKLREKYTEFSPALLQIIFDQNRMRAGSFGHVAVYDYSRLSTSQRATSAQVFYDQTLASSVTDGDLGGLKLVSDCTECNPPKELTNLCGNSLEKPNCGDGFFLKEMKAEDDTSCLFVCESLCSTEFCNAGTCTHHPPYEPKCRCPSNTVGPQCEPVTVTDGGGDNGDKNTPANLTVIIACSVTGGVLLLLILAAIGYFVFRRNKNAKKDIYHEKSGHINEDFAMEKSVDSKQL